MERSIEVKVARVIYADGDDAIFVFLTRDACNAWIDAYRGNPDDRIEVSYADLVDWQDVFDAAGVEAPSKQFLQPWR